LHDVPSGPPFVAHDSTGEEAERFPRGETSVLRLGGDGLSAGHRSPDKTAPAGTDQIVKRGVTTIRAAHDFPGDALANRMIFSAARFCANVVERSIHGGQGTRIKFAFDHLSAP
jgi:hypothetical protein